jgi:SAM-dependent methyltransferase
MGRFYRRYILYPKLSKHLQGRVLDVGCGLGDFLSFRRGTIGADINPLVVQHCRRNGFDARLIENGYCLPFADACFDGVVLDNVLEHLIEPSATILEIFRVLRIGGRFIVGVPGIKGFASDPDHKIYYNDTALESVINAAGFDPIRFFYMPLPFGNFLFGKILKQHCLYGIFGKK